MCLFCFKIENITLCSRTVVRSCKQLRLCEFVFSIAAFIVQILTSLVSIEDKAFFDDNGESIAGLRQLIFSSRRKWHKIFHKKETAHVDFAYELLWVSKSHSGSNCSEMRHICNDGSSHVLYKKESRLYVKETIIYDIPDPYYTSSMPDHEYHPTMIVLFALNILTRHNLYTGAKYDMVCLGSYADYRHLTWSSITDEVIVKSRKTKCPSTGDFIATQVFSLHPFRHKWSLAFSEAYFPGKMHSHLGKFKNIELEDSLLFLVTTKGYVLCYSLHHIIQGLPANSLEESKSTGPPIFVTFTPPLLFHSKSHTDVISFGGYPFMYIKPTNDATIEVRNLDTNELFGEEITFEGFFDQKIAPDNLSFHVDGSNRMIHTKSSDLRILSLSDAGNTKAISCDFQYSKIHKKNVPDVKSSSRGRICKQKFILDNSLNCGLVYGFECDLKIFFILEIERLMNHGVKLKCVSFHDIQSYQILDTLQIGITVEGDIDTNTINIFMEKDFLTIVSKNKNASTILFFKIFNVEDPTFDSLSDASSLHEPFSHATHRRSRGRRRSRGNSDKDSDEEWVP